MANINLDDRIASLYNQTEQPFPGIALDLQDRIASQAAIVDPIVQVDESLLMQVKYDLGELPEVDTVYELYADNARSIGAKEFLSVDQFIQLDQVQPWLATIPQRRNFADKTIESYRRGGEHIDLHIAIAAADRDGRPEDVDRLVNIANKTDRLEELDPIESNMVTQFIYGLYGILPGIIKGVDEGLDEAALGAATGVGAALTAQAAAAVVPPTLAITPLTVTAGAVGGAGIGLQFGMAEFWYREGKGSMILEMRRNEVDHETAGTIASIAAVPYAALELIQIKRITPGLKGPIKKVLLASTTRVIGRAVKRHGGILTREVRDEVIQETILFAAADLGAALKDNPDIEFDAKYFTVRSQRLWDTAKQAAVSMALLPLPSVVFTAMGEKGITIKSEPSITLTPQQEIEHLEFQKREITADETIAEIDKEKLYDELNKQIEQVESNIKPIPVAENREEVTVQAGTTVEGSPISFGAISDEDATTAPAIQVEIKVPTKESTITVEGQPVTFSHTIPSYDIFQRAHFIKDESNMADADYRAIAEKATGKTSMKDMTYQEGQRFLEALQDNTSVTVAFDPSHPDSKITGLNPFGRLSKVVTLRELLTPQDITAESIGLGDVVAGPIAGKRNLDHEFGISSNSIDQVLALLNKHNKINRRDSRRSQFKGEPTAAESRMAELINAHEDAPDFLDETETEIFNFFRKLSRDIINGENRVRRNLGRQEIPFRAAYFRHVADESATAILDGQMDIPPEIEAMMKRTVNDKIYNPMERHRKLASELEVLYSRDLRAVTKSMVWTGLKEIHLSEPLVAFNEDLKALGDAIPKRNQEWVRNYVNVNIKGQQELTDKKINELVTKTGFGKALRILLQPFGKVLSDRPVTHFNSIMGRIQNVSALSVFRPKIIIRNTTQKLHDLAFWPTKHVITARLLASEVASKLINESLFFRGYTGIEQMPVGLISKMEKQSMMPFQWTAVGNAKGSMKVGFLASEELIIKKKFADLGWADPKRDYTEPNGFFYPSELARLKKEMEVGSGAAQYDYTALALPGIFRFKTLGALTKFQSWWMNFFFRFHREAAIRTFTGRTSYGAKIPMSWRLAQAKYLMTGVPILQAMGYSASTLLNVAPTGLAPTAGMMFALYGYVTARDRREREKREREIINLMPLMIPGGLAAKDAEAVWSGEKNIDEFLFYDQKANDAKDAWW